MEIMYQKRAFILFFLLISSLLQLQAQDIPIVNATLDQDNTLHDEAFWGNWAVPVGDATASSTLCSQGKNNYEVKNLTDDKQNTAWVEGKADYGIGEYIAFKMQYDETDPLSCFGCVYQFFGLCYIQNGYCKSDIIWRANSRVKRFKLYHNNTAICFIDLMDTQRLQVINISKFFTQNHEGVQEGRIDVKNGDVLKFEIIDVYKGEKYKDTAISTFIGQGMGN